MPTSTLYRKLQDEARAGRRSRAPQPSRPAVDRVSNAPVVPGPAELREATLAELARIIARDWSAPYFGAKPYLLALTTLHVVRPGIGYYGVESGADIVRYFLSNAATWRGPVARAVKAELRSRVGLR